MGHESEDNCREVKLLSGASMLTDMPFFTVLITAYNYGQYIDQALESALRQSLQNDQFEVIVIDDGSTDDTCERVARFGETVSYFYQENAGQAAAFNAGLRRARGEFIAFLDADDYFENDKLRMAREFLVDHPEVDLLYHPLLQVDESACSLGIHPVYTSDRIIREPLTSFLNGSLPEPVATTGIVARRSILQKLLPIPPAYRICADSYLMNTIPFIATAISYLATPLANYRLHAANHYNCFSQQAGHYYYKDEKLLLEKLLLDMQAIKKVASKLNIDISDYLRNNDCRLVVQHAVVIRDSEGALPAANHFFRNIDCLQHLTLLEKCYRVTSVCFRIISGPRFYNAIAGRYLDSPPYRLIHSIFSRSRSSRRVNAK